MPSQVDAPAQCEAQINCTSVSAFLGGRVEGLLRFEKAKEQIDNNIVKNLRFKMLSLILCKHKTTYGQVTTSSRSFVYMRTILSGFTSFKLSVLVALFTLNNYAIRLAKLRVGISIPSHIISIPWTSAVCPCWGSEAWGILRKKGFQLRLLSRSECKIAP